MANNFVVVGLLYLKMLILRFIITHLWKTQNAPRMHYFYHFCFFSGGGEAGACPHPLA